MGMAVWPMVEFEADDALAAGAELAAKDPRVERVFICTPDKDLAQSVRGTRVVQMDRRKRTIRDEAGVREKFGVAPESIPDYLALVGDASDGYPGLPGWGAKSTAAVLGEVRAPRGDPRGSARVGRQRVGGQAVGDLRARTRTRLPLSHARDAAHGHPALHVGGRARVEGPDGSVPAAGGAARRRCPRDHAAQANWRG